MNGNPTHDRVQITLAVLTTLAQLCGGGCGKCSDTATEGDHGAQDAKVAAARLDRLPAALRAAIAVSDCSSANCGNAAKLGDDYLGPLTADGSSDPGQPTLFRLVPGSLRLASGACGGATSLSLGVKDGELTGVGASECQGQALVGAQFQIAKKDGPSYAIRIQARADVESWERAPRMLPAYAFEVLPSGEGSTGAPVDLCSTDTPWDDSTLLLVGNSKGLPWKDPATYALLVQGETYAHDATIKQHDPKWFYIACAGTGLAKLRLLGFDPMKSREPTEMTGDPDASTGDERQATLKMITAKYCGDFSFTIGGTPLYWARPTESIPAAGSPQARRIGPIESRWGAKGATCISHWRAASPANNVTQTNEDLIVGIIKNHCNLKSCGTQDEVPCPQSKTDNRIWQTCTVDHIGGP